MNGAAVAEEPGPVVQNCYNGYLTIHLSPIF